MNTYEFAMSCTISAEYWAAEYAKNDQYKWQANWAASRAKTAWAQHYSTL